MTVTSGVEIPYNKRGQPRRPKEAVVTEPETDRSIAEEQRKAIFLALVEAQDRGANVPESRKEVAGQFGITEQQVQLIEREGLALNWPPL